MLKKTFKTLLWVGKWYLRLTVFLLAFIGVGEIAEQCGKLSGLSEKVDRIKNPKTRRQYKRKIKRLIQNHVWEMAVLKWKFGLGLPIEKSEEKQRAEESGE